ncbi:MAG TPA: MarR family winged helix-turn-helix transcriptional regulator [Nocardioides sp.]|uniref:MarR family winged helix-turn-helix transcriptional regulator n=1 Tax=Nocardioides sp. TaxID=35761 RepID=UPI002E37B15B|nr:MarR family winged helix-turn-helix transcriptional regulator [Nocardioides sp.]HEX5086859.1 MarR family winged helix-turn-helix transcriptional regulator [Nocardioides sp.]
MSTQFPAPDAPERRRNLVVQLREAYSAINDLVPEHLVAHGFTDFRPAHSKVFEYLDDTGTTVNTLARRASMTKQAMAQLVAHLEDHGYVTRQPDPDDRRAKLVLPTDRGRRVFEVAQSWVPQVHARVQGLLGSDRFEELRRDLEAIRREFADQH